MTAIEFLQSPVPWWEMLLRLMLATLLGMAVGWEREANQKDAGLRTHMLVGLGSCGILLVVLSLAAAPSVEAKELINIDPSRVIQGVIGGIGFLGAGAIIHGGDSKIHGLTTGAGIWLIGAVGLACGAGSYLLAISMTVIALMVVILSGIFLKPKISEMAKKDDEN